MPDTHNFPPTDPALKDVGVAARKLVLDARMNVKYHGMREALFSRLNAWSKTLTAVVGGAGFAVILGEWVRAEVVSGLVAVFATIAASQKWTEQAKLHASLRQEWINVRFSTEAVLRRAAPTVADSDRKSIRDRLEELLATRAELAAREPADPDLKRLERAQLEVAQELGLINQASNPLVLAASDGARAIGS